jgi:hypothetical protein
MWKVCSLNDKISFFVSETKESKHVVYVLQIWLYIVCKNPFDLARLSKEHDLIGTGLDSLSQRLICVLLKLQLSYNQDTSFYVRSDNSMFSKKSNLAYNSKSTCTNFDSKQGQL